MTAISTARNRNAASIDRPRGSPGGRQVRVVPGFDCPCHGLKEDADGGADDSRKQEPGEDQGGHVAESVCHPLQPAALEQRRIGEHEVDDGP